MSGSPKVASSDGRRAGVRRVLAMETVSGVGDGVFWVGLVAIMLDRHAGAGAFVLAALARLGPRALLSVPAGVIADRFDRRRLLVGLDLARAACMVVLALAASSGATLAVLLVPVLAAYTLAAPYRPALTAAMPLVAGERDLSSANALVGTVRQLMTFVGPVLGAVLVATTSSSAAFWANAASFAVSAVLLAGVASLSGGAPGRVPAAATARDEAAWDELRATPGITVISGLVGVMYLARGAELVLFAYAATAVFDLGSAGTGVLTAAVGLGAVFALPVAARVADVEHPGAVLFVSVLSTAIPLALLTVSHSRVLGCALLVVLGAGVVVFEVLSVVLLQRSARREVLGRVFGVIGAASNAGKLAGAVAAPAAVAAVGLDRTLHLTALVALVAAVAAWPGLVRLTAVTRAHRDAMRPTIEVLAGLRLFQGASPVALERVAATLTETTATVGTDVIVQGDPADDLYVVREGHLVVVENGREVNRMAPGDWFGEIGLVQRRARTATVTASTDVVLWRIPGDAFLEALEGATTETSALVQVMADRLARSRAVAGPPTDPHA